MGRGGQRGLRDQEQARTTNAGKERKGGGGGGGGGSLQQQRRAAKHEGSKQKQISVAFEKQQVPAPFHCTALRLSHYTCLRLSRQRVLEEVGRKGKVLTSSNKDIFVSKNFWVRDGVLYVWQCSDERSVLFSLFCFFPTLIFPFSPFPLFPLFLPSCGVCLVCCVCVRVVVQSSLY
jgi:hypothetical protein